MHVFRNVPQLVGALSMIAGASVTSSSALAATINLTGTVRDFNTPHPDMEVPVTVVPGVVTGLVESTLVGKNPVYIGSVRQVRAGTHFTLAIVGPDKVRVAPVCSATPTCAPT